MGYENPSRYVITEADDCRLVMREDHLLPTVGQSHGVFELRCWDLMRKVCRELPLLALHGEPAPIVVGGIASPENLTLGCGGRDAQRDMGISCPAVGAYQFAGDARTGELFTHGNRIRRSCLALIAAHEHRHQHGQNANEDSEPSLREHLLHCRPPSRTMPLLRVGASVAQISPRAIALGSRK